MAVDPLRHLSVFSPHAFGQRRVDVIGCGATGSRIVLSLAKLGVENIHVWDFDQVEEHNIPNQAFGITDIGLNKAIALAALVKAATGTDIAVHEEKVDGSQQLGEVVFLLTDTMLSRKEIWSGALKYKLRTNILIETRMGADSGRVYSLNPNRPGQIKAYEETLYADEEAEVSACGASVSVGPTAETVSGLAVWQLIRWFSIEQGGDDELDNEIIFSLRPMMTISRKF
jgi:molybdopterin/thiamine biosynthesis adenylyltransferase